MATVTGPLITDQLAVRMTVFWLLFFLTEKNRQKLDALDSPASFAVLPEEISIAGLSFP